jgi:hypothetical protein
MTQPEQLVIRHVIDADALAGILGCGKRTVLDELLEAERQSFLGGHTDLGPVLERAVLEGVPFPDLDREEPAHEHAAMRLAYACVSRREPFAGSTVAWADWQAGVRVAEAVLGDEARTLLAFLRDGRALFGARPVGFGSVYAFLSPAETATLRRALAPVAAGPVRDSVALCARLHAGLFVQLPFAG